MSNRIPIPYRWTAFAAICLHACLLTHGAFVHSPTFDETAHLPAGLAIWKLGRVDVYPHNPPLVKAVAALPLLAVEHKIDWTGIDSPPLDRSEFAIGYKFIDDNEERSFLLYSLARIACLPFSILGGIVCLLWANQISGPRAGLLALLLWCFCPNVLGHGQLITPDVPAASLGITSAWLVDRWLKAKTNTSAFLAGSAIGLALLTKFTWLVWFPLVPAAWLFSRRDQRSSLCQCALVLALSWYILCAGYHFQDMFRPLKDFSFHTILLGGQKLNDDNPIEADRHNRFTNSLLGAVPVPIPSLFLEGVDRQLYDFERGSRSYLCGEWADRGWHYYYLYGLLIKLPVGIWILLVIRLNCNVQGANTVLLWAPPLAVLILVSSKIGFTHHVRYVFPVLPFLYIWCSQLAAAKNRLINLIANIAVCLAIASSLSTFPHFASYFSEAVGGPANGGSHLVDSNLSWGQDLLLLRNWIERNNVKEPVNLVYFGNMDPRTAGISFLAPPRLSKSAEALPLLKTMQPGWYIVDASFVRGLNRRIPDGSGGWSRAKSIALDYSYFQLFSPCDRIGYSLNVYKLSKADLARIAEWAIADPEDGSSNVSKPVRN